MGQKQSSVEDTNAIATRMQLDILHKCELEAIDRRKACIKTLVATEAYLRSMGVRPYLFPVIRECMDETKS